MLPVKFIGIYTYRRVQKKGRKEFINGSELLKIKMMVFDEVKII